MATETEVVETDSSSTEVETEESTAKEAGEKTGDDQPEDGETSQEKASTGDSDEKDPEPDEKGRIPIRKDQFERLKRQGKTLAEIRELGIDSKEHAEFLRREADRLEFILDQIESKPEDFFSDLKREYPEQYRAHIETAATNITAETLKGYALAFRKRGEKGDGEASELLNALADDVLGKKPEPKEKPEGKDNLLSERFDFFAERVSSDLESKLTAKILEKTNGTEFGTERRKQKFIADAIQDLKGRMERDPIFIRRRNAAQDPRHGLTAQQRAEVVSLYMGQAEGEKMDSAIRETLSLLGLDVKKSKGKGKEERREVSGSGIPTSGKIRDDVKEKVKKEIAAQGLSGVEAATEYLARMRKLRAGG